MNNYKLEIQYDGTEYSGWQIQQNSQSIQQKISETIKIIIKDNVNLIGSGRTDAGVHALGQIANFKTEHEIDIYKFRHSVNSILPPDISVLNISKINEKFHSRFDAKKRSYIYLFSKIKSPFYNRYSYFYHGELNCTLLNKVSKILIGKMDFTSFSKKNSDTENKICTVYTAGWKETKQLAVFHIEADRFLHGMVRSIIGTLLFASKNGYNEKLITDIINSKDRSRAGESVPPRGLFLFKVKY